MDKSTNVAAPRRPRISVITCTYNSEPYIRENLTSVWEGEPPYEQIIVDASSTDKTLAIVEEFHQRGHNIQIHSRPPAGIADAMNYGMRAATGDIVQILHSDDYSLDAELYKKVADVFETTKCRWLYGKGSTVNQRGESIGEIPPKWIHRYRYWLLALMNYIPHPALFMHKDLIEEYGYFDEDLKVIMDWDYWLRIGAKFSPHVIGEYWCAFRLHEDSLSTQEVFSKKLHAEERIVLYRHFGKIRGYLIYMAHYTLYLLRHMKNASLYRRGK